METLSSMKADLKLLWRLMGMLAPVLCATLFASLFTMRLQGADEKSFGSPDEAVNALIAAATIHDTNAMHAIFGPEGHRLVSPDPVQATNDYKVFVQRLKEKVQLGTNSDSNLTLELGEDGWPFPIPLVKQDGHWFFDTAAGRQEILNRRIGMDELGAISVCRAYVDA